MKTTVILTPGVGNPGSVPHRMLRFRWIPLDPLDPVDPVQNSVRLSNTVFFIMIFALFAGIGDLFLVPTLEKPPFAGRESLIVKIYIHKLPIHRIHAAG